MNLCFRSTCRKHCAETPLEIVLIHWLAQIADDTIVQCAGPISIVGVGCHEDCRDRSLFIDKVSVEFDWATRSACVPSACPRAPPKVKKNPHDRCGQHPFFR